MTERVTLEVPADLAQQARTIAHRTQRRFEDVLVDWLRAAGAEPPMESLPDEDLLALCDGQLPAELQEELSALLERQREGVLAEGDRPRLDRVMSLYRQGLVRKAQAIKTAVRRGLRPSLS